VGMFVDAVEDALPRLLTVGNGLCSHLCFTPSELVSRLLLDDGEHFVLAQDQVLLVVDLDFRSGVLADQDAVTLLDVQGQLLPLFVDLSLADGHDFRLHRLLLGRIGDDDSSFANLLLLEPLDEDSVVERSNLHAFLLNRYWIERDPVRARGTDISTPQSRVLARRGTLRWALGAHRRQFL